MAKSNICILGGTGFVGHSIARRLVEHGHRVRIISRRRERHRDLLVLPTLEVVQGSSANRALLLREFRRADAVINLVGILNESGHRGKGFAEVHVHHVARIIEACKLASVNRLLHMSALNASESAPSHYLRSKARGEYLAHHSGMKGLHVTSFCPSVIFGPNDSFVNRFAQLLKLAPGVFPLACADARFQPVYVEDVATAFVKALEDRYTFGQSYDLCGPRTYTLYELVSYVASQLGLNTRIIKLNKLLSWGQAMALEFFPGKPFSLDNYRSLKVDSVCSGSFPTDFGIKPAGLESVVPAYLGANISDKFSVGPHLTGRN
ncbi:MAG: complex I NDUFA9 subunit family protein [Gammaproteobacteria bacterium]|nr:MAG: complex I NDUFA9 subunit family protein [Gammaproteobacteria bacterium]